MNRQSRREEARASPVRPERCTAYQKSGDVRDSPVGESTFYGQVILHYLPGTKGWTSTFGRHPTALWVRPNPTIPRFYRVRGR